MCVCVCLVEVFLWRASIREGLCEPQMFQLASFPGRRAFGSNSKATGARKEGEWVNMSRREKLLKRKAPANHFVISKLWQARERACYKKELIKELQRRGRRCEGVFPYRPKSRGMKVRGRREASKQSKGHLHLIYCRRYCGSHVYCPGTFFGLFISFILLVYSICHPKLVGWTWLAWFAWPITSLGLKRQGIFQEGLFLFQFLSGVFVQQCALMSM